MKRIAVHNLYEDLNPILFSARDAPIGDDLLLPLNDLHAHGQTRGVEFVPLLPSTRVDRLDGALFLDFPDLRSDVARSAFEAPIPKWLLTFEPPVVRVENWRPTSHAFFKNVFTWDDALVAQNKRCVKIHYAIRIPVDVPERTKTRFCTLVASNKRSSHPRELYSQRLLAILWYERNALDLFDLYGPGWDGHPSWRGVIPAGQKRAILGRYEFAICYENAAGFQGYVTEKILDCLLVGTIPIYWGAPNVDRWIPHDCYIDRRDFASYESLHAYLTTMPFGERQQFRAAARAFFKSPAAQAFSTDTFARTIVDRILG